MDYVWFRKSLSGWYWKPITWQGRAVMFVWAMSNIWYFLDVDADAHSASDTLLGFAPFFVLSTLALLFVIHKKSERWI